MPFPAGFEHAYAGGVPEYLSLGEPHPHTARFIEHLVRALEHAGGWDGHELDPGPGWRPPDA